jgi:hypothetical protein
MSSWHTKRRRFSTHRVPNWNLRLAKLIENAPTFCATPSSQNLETKNCERGLKDANCIGSIGPVDKIPRGARAQSADGSLMGKIRVESDPIPSNREWHDKDNYRWICSLPASSCAWEFLRRNPSYEKAYRFQPTMIDPLRAEGNNACGDLFSNASVWKLLRFENPELDTRRANVFWQPGACRQILPLTASSLSSDAAIPCLPRDGLRCRIATHDEGREKHHVLFAQDGRFLQLEIHGPKAFWNSRLTTDVLFTAEYAAARLRALRRLTDLMTSRGLRASLYPPEPRSKRLAQVLQVLDGERAGATHRELAAVIYGVARVETDWRHPSDHLRSWVRRTLRCGHDLIIGGYARLLK